MLAKVTEKEQEGIQLQRYGAQRDLLRKMRDIPGTCDVDFLVKSQKFPAHRGWIAASSPVLCNMLTSETTDCNKKDVLLEGIEVSTWKNILNYLYFEEVKVNDIDDALKLLSCAKRFEFKQIESEVFDFIVSSTNEENCYYILAEADLMGFKLLKKEVIQFIINNFFAVCRYHTIGLLNIETIEEIVKNKSLKIFSEMDVFDSVLKWLITRNHAVSESIISRYSSLSDKETMKTIEEAKQESNKSLLSENDANILTQYIDLNSLSDLELKQATLISREANLKKLFNSCLDLLLRKSSEENKTSALGNIYTRNNKPRSVPVFSFTHRFANMTAFTENYTSADVLESPWVSDPSGYYRWSLQARFRGREEVEEKWMSVFLCVEGVDTANADKEIGFQLFVMNYDLTDVAKIQPLFTEKLRKFSGGGWGFSSMMKLEEAKSSIDRKTDSITVGATVYLGSLT